MSTKPITFKPFNKEVLSTQKNFGVWKSKDIYFYGLPFSKFPTSGDKNNFYLSNTGTISFKVMNEGQGIISFYVTLTKWSVCQSGIFWHDLFCTFYN